MFQQYHQDTLSENLSHYFCGNYPILLFILHWFQIHAGALFRHVDQILDFSVAMNLIYDSYSKISSF